MSSALLSAGHPPVPEHAASSRGADFRCVWALVRLRIRLVAQGACSGCDKFGESSWAFELRLAAERYE